MHLLVPLRDLFVDYRKVGVHFAKRLHDGSPVRCVLCMYRLLAARSGSARSNAYELPSDYVVELGHGLLVSMTGHRTLRRPVRSRVEDADMVSYPRLGSSHS